MDQSVIAELILDSIGLREGDILCPRDDLKV